MDLLRKGRMGGWMGGLIDGRMNGFHTDRWTWLNNIKVCGM
jgi:hypothetical protein